MHLIVGGAVILLAGGYFLDKAGEGVNDASNGLVKIALAGAAIYAGAKYLKVLK